MLGLTWSATLDGALDTISQKNTEMANALDAVSEFIRLHPEHEEDPNLTLARMALL